ncbi:YkgJ family cysteine cluster protein [Desulfosarcina cetonica]|uniref:YkgJ family cysteine cluster protein n=1 Tax=Desulfosarcina cetonica TaxID=90730 RepID=UPI0006D03551|nr:YkgJ family cysteine cluster protein [Desulfosarcina cetonica]
MEGLYQRSYFFDAGLRFACQCCGDCCTGAPGIVRVTPAEIDRIAHYLGVKATDLKSSHLAPWEGGHRIRERADGRCLFFEAGCRIYAVRPRQCRTFPFWFTNLRSEARWQKTCRACPGIGRGRLYTKTEILDLLAGDD